MNTKECANTKTAELFVDGVIVKMNFPDNADQRIMSQVKEMLIASFSGSSEKMHLENRILHSHSNHENHIERNDCCE